MTTLGLLLAGGLARRMGGGDKPLQILGGRPILHHVIARLQPQCDGLILNANGDPARFAQWGLPVVADDVPDFAGPLAGILAGLDWAALNRPDIDGVVSVAADTPFIPHDLVARFRADLLAQSAMLASAASGGWSHPVVGLWPVGIRHQLRKALVEDCERKIDRFTARFALATVEWPVMPVDPFFNVNTPEELAEAEALVTRLLLT